MRKSPALGQLAAMRPSRECELLELWQGPTQRVPPGSVLDWFEAQAERTPDGVAVQAGDAQVTYGTLNALANRVAHLLIAEGAGAEAIVAVVVPRSIWMIVAVLAAWKCGAAYLPIDPGDPPGRVAALLGDACPRATLTTAAVAPLVSGVVSHCLDAPELPARLRRLPARNPARSAYAERPAYLIYTSGSTGEPKGVVVGHGALANYVWWARQRYVSTPGRGLGAPVNTPLAFDATVTSLYLPLIVGERVILVDDQSPLESLGAVLTRGGSLTLVKLTPAHLRGLEALLETATSAARVERFVVGGEALTTATARFWSESLPDLEIVNEYGPTEAVVGTCIFGYRGTPPLGRDVPIGRAAANVRVYVLDAHLWPAPIGAAGELYLGGRQLARGYWRRPALTAVRFVADPDGAPGARMYRTGDRARWRADGTLEFLGRVDEQVKIRGYRIELGELEAAVRRCPGVADAVATVQTDAPGEPSLVAYVVPSAAGECDVESIRRRLEADLPPYLIPAAIVPLAALPLTRHGKVDRAALPAPERPCEPYRAAKTPAQLAVCGAVADLLGVPHVGLDDRFFALGGDSIGAFTLVSRLRRAGLYVAPRDVFQQPTMERLAAVVRSTTARVETEPAYGPTPATPIVRWLQESGAPIRQYHQAILLQVPSAPGISTCAGALQAIVDYHDALRGRLLVGPDRVWQLAIDPPSAVRAAERLRLVSISDATRGDDRTVIAEAYRAAEARLDPERGVLFQAVWFDNGADEPGRVLLVVHHLVVDAVSWQILRADLRAAWEAIAAGRPVALPPPGSSFRGWAGHLLAEAHRAPVVQQLDYWRRTLLAVAPLAQGPLDPTRHRVGTAQRLSLTLPTTTTQALLTRVPSALRGDVADVLLTALAVALTEWRDGEGVARMAVPVVDVESHGRDESGGSFDLSRTVGWFTSVHPLRLDVGEALIVPGRDAALARACAAVVQQRRAAPAGGLGFGMLRYLNAATATMLRELPRPEIGFNYLGRAAAAGRGEWMPAPELPVLSGGADPQMPLAHPIELNAVTLDRPEGAELHAHWTWAGDLLPATAVDELAQRWFDVLAELVASTDRAGVSRRTPADVPLVALTESELERIEREYPDADDILPLLPLQEGLLFQALYDPASADLYVVELRIELEGTLDAERVRAALDGVLRRHDALRAAFCHEGVSRPVQVISGRVPRPLLEIEMAADSGSDTSERVERLLSERRRGVDLRRAPLLRMTIIRTAPSRHVLALAVHHLVLDGWSMQLLMREFWSLYARSGDPSELDPTTPYREYLRWAANQDRDAITAHWASELAELESGTQLASASPATGGERRNVLRVLPASLTKALIRQARQSGVTVNSAVQVAWSLVLAGLTGRDDVVFGTTVSCRPPEVIAAETMVGLFVNTLPLRVRVRPAETLDLMLRRVQDSQVRRLGAETTGLAELQAIAGVGPLFDTLLVYENYPTAGLGAAPPDGELRITAAQGHDATHYPLSLIVRPGERLRLRVDHDATLFTSAGVDEIVDRLVRVLAAIAHHPDRRVGVVDLLADAERRRLLEARNATVRPYPPGTVVDRFDAQAATTPERVAVLCERTHVTYAAFRTRANRIARWLTGRGVGPEQVVGIALPRSIDMCAAVLGVLKSGAAYVPIDVDHPPARVAQVLDDARPVCVLTIASLVDRLPATAAVVALDSSPAAEQMTLAASHDPIDGDRQLPLRLDHPAYVIYTSGSTGRPKGIELPHRVLVNLLDWHADTMPRRARTLQFAALTFDSSVHEMFAAWVGGGVLAVATETMRSDVERLARFIAEEDVDKAVLPVVIAQELAARARTAASVAPADVITTGEALKITDDLRRWIGRGATLANHYGPSETHVVTAHTFERDATRWPVSAPIGRPVSNTRVYVLGPGLALVPDGAVGELYIAGVVLARGYLRRPDLTAARFVADPYGSPGARMYRTGDLVRWRADATLHFLGRADAQVKIRGIRVELGDVEAGLLACRGVAHATAVTRADAAGETQLIGYVVADDGAPLDPLDVRRDVATRLPEALVPAVVVVLDALPLTVHGKVDRRALPTPELPRRTFRPPRSPLEQILCELYGEVLGVDTIGIDDDFFDLGGHSLTAMRLVGRIRARFDIDLPIKRLFDDRTVTGLAAAIEEAVRLQLDAISELEARQQIAPTSRSQH